jgi:hypothetical protein
MSVFTKKVDMEACLRKGLSQELILIMAFIEQQDYQLENYISEFSEKLVVGGQGIKTNEYTDRISVSNISNDQYDLEATFKQDLPNYIRKSQLLMLWTMLEDTLGYIVKELSAKKNIRFRKKGYKESIFIYYVKSLEKIDGAGLVSHRSVIFLNDNVREIRNSIVHGFKPKVQHKEIEVTKLGVLVSGKYVREVCMSINELARCV